MRHLLIAVTFSLAALPAQAAFRASRFLPKDYHNVVHVDLVQLRDSGVWDELETGMTKLMFAQMEKSAGFPIEALDRVTVIPKSADPEAGDDQPKQRDQQVVVYEGNRPLGIPFSVAGNSAYVDEMIGDYEVKRQQQWRDELFFQPRPEIQIMGSTGLLRPILEGAPGHGMPCADVLSLLSTRKDGLILYFAMHVADERLNGGAMKEMFPGTEWPEDDTPQYLMVTVSAIGDPDDPHIQLEAVMRHRKGDEGLAITEKAADALIEKAIAMPQLRLLVPLLKGVQRSRDRSDLSLKWDLGRARTAAGHMATVVAPMMMLSRDMAAEAEAIEIIEEVEAEEVAPPKKKAGEKKKGEKKKG